MLLPMNVLRSYGTQSATAFGAVIRNPNLRWLELAWSASVVGHYAYLIAVSVSAYGVGGEEAVGLIILARLIPAALAAPFAGLLGDRFRRERVLLVTNAGVSSFWSQPQRSGCSSRRRPQSSMSSRWLRRSHTPVSTS